MNASNFGLFAYRVSFGLLMFIGHGLGKLKIIGTDKVSSFPDPIGLGPQISYYATAFAEGICTILIILGLGTRFASFVLTFTMLIAAFVVHSADPFFPGKEKAILYAAGFFGLIFTGAGKLSADNKIRGTR